MADPPLGRDNDEEFSFTDQDVEIFLQLRRHQRATLDQLFRLSRIFFVYPFATKEELLQQLKLLRNKELLYEGYCQELGMNYYTLTEHSECIATFVLRPDAASRPWRREHRDE